MGNVKSQVLYSLSPDTLSECGYYSGEEDARAGGREWALVHFENDILEGNWKRESGVRAGVEKVVCNGGWNTTGMSGKRDKKSMGKVLHEGRRKVEGEGVELERLF